MESVTILGPTPSTTPSRALELAYVAALEKLMAALHKCEEAQ